MDPDAASSPLQLTVRRPEDLLAVPPVVLGFWPHRSAVMLTFDARRPFHARVDLPDELADHPAAADELARVLVEPAVRHEVGSVVLLLYTPRAAAADRVWEALAERLASAAIEVREALRVTDDRWFPLRGTGRQPVDGVPYDVSHHRFVAENVLAGRVTLDSRDALAATVRPDPRAVARVLAVLPTHPAPARAAAVLEARGHAAVRQESRWVRSVVEHGIATGVAPGDTDTARLLLGLRHGLVRDAAWVAALSAPARAAAAWWGDVLRRAPDELAASPAVLLAWSAFRDGDGALAWCGVDRCREVEPDHALAGQLARALEQAVPPGDLPDPLSSPRLRSGA